MRSLICGALSVLAILSGCQGALPAFSHCDVTCGGGIANSETIIRTDNGVIALSHTVMCNMVPCDGVSGSVGNCSESCDMGFKTLNNITAMPCNTQPCILPIVDNCAADLVFLLDRTDRMSELHFEYAKQMIHDLILMQAVGPTAVNVIVISFAYNAVVEYIETASAADGARKALQLSRAADVSYPAYAFYGLNKYLAENGRPGVPKIAVIISTGTETKYELERKEEMNLAVENGVKLYAVYTSKSVFPFNISNIELYKTDDWRSLAEKIRSDADCTEYSLPTKQLPVEQVGTPLVNYYANWHGGLLAADGRIQEPREFKIQMIYHVIRQCEESFSPFGPCNVSCGAMGVQTSDRVCQTIVNGVAKEWTKETHIKKCFIKCTTTTTTTTTPKPMTTSDGICERCDYTKGQIWVSDVENCHKYYICEKVDDVDGMWYWRKWHVHCGQLYWDQSRKTCTPEMQPDCINGTAEAWVGPSTTIGPCPFEVLADPRLFQHIETGDIFNCTEGMIFNETECTCVVDSLVQPACSDDLLLHFPYDVDYDDITCHNAKGYAYGGGIVGIVDDAQRGKVAEFDGMTRLEVPFMRSWFKDRPIEGFTVSLWVKRDAANDGRVGFVNNGDCINETTFGIYGDENSGQNAYGVLDTVPSGLQQTAPASMTNQWTHLAMVYNTINMVLYVNGVPGAPESMIGTIATVQCPMVIGFIGNQPGYGFFEGRIDDLRVYTRALGQGDITNLYNGVPLVSP